MTSKVSGVATSIRTADGYTHVRYHQTDVVSFNDKWIQLNSDGWFTNTTKNRMNQASNQFDLGYRVFQKDKKWYVEYKGKTYDYVDCINLPR